MLQVEDKKSTYVKCNLIEVAGRQCCVWWIVKAWVSDAVEQLALISDLPDHYVRMVECAASLSLLRTVCVTKNTDRRNSLMCLGHTSNTDYCQHKYTSMDTSWSKAVSKLQFLSGLFNYALSYVEHRFQAQKVHQSLVGSQQTLNCFPKQQKMDVCHTFFRQSCSKLTLETIVVAGWILMTKRWQVGQNQLPTWSSPFPSSLSQFPVRACCPSWVSGMVLHHLANRLALWQTCRFLQLCFLATDLWELRVKKACWSHTCWS